MSVKIRLSRWGTKKKPYYRIVVANSRAPRDGDYLEKVGTFNPMLPDTDPKRLIMDAERIKHWLSTGAQPTERVQRFLFKAGVLKEEPKKKTGNLGVTKKDLKKVAEEKAAAAAEAKKAREAAKKAEAAAAAAAVAA